MCLLFAALFVCRRMGCHARYFLVRGTISDYRGGYVVSCTDVYLSVLQNKPWLRHAHIHSIQCHRPSARLAFALWQSLCVCSAGPSRLDRGRCTVREGLSCVYAQLGPSGNVRFARSSSKRCDFGTNALLGATTEALLRCVSSHSECHCRG